jgi:hypothetical protein
MALNPPSEVRDVYGITNEEKLLIKAYLQGSVYSWVKNRKGERFAARDLVGGENFEWQGTPLIVLYDKHTKKGKVYDKAIAGATQDLGWLLKAVLNDDKRRFEVGKSGLTAAYRWAGNEP